jgi:hypothetical protein
VHCYVLEKLQLPTEDKSIGVFRNVRTYVLNCTAPYLKRLFIYNALRTPKSCLRLQNFELWSMKILLVFRNVESGFALSCSRHSWLKRLFIYNNVRTPKSCLRLKNFELWSMKILLVFGNVESRFALSCSRHSWMACSQSVIVLLYTSLFVSWWCSNILLTRRASARDPIRVCLFAEESPNKRSVYSLNPCAGLFIAVYCGCSVQSVDCSAKNCLLFSDFNVINPYPANVEYRVSS